VPCGQNVLVGAAEADLPTGSALRPHFLLHPRNSTGVFILLRVQPLAMVAGNGASTLENSA